MNGSCCMVINKITKLFGPIRFGGALSRSCGGTTGRQLRDKMRRRHDESTGPTTSPWKNVEDTRCRLSCFDFSHTLLIPKIPILPFLVTTKSTTTLAYQTMYKNSPHPYLTSFLPCLASISGLTSKYPRKSGDLFSV